MNLHISSHGLATDETADALADVAEERLRQVGTWGVQTRPDGTSESYSVHADAAKLLTDQRAEAGTLTWADILSEEVLEAFSEEDHDALREELIQVAAVALSWVEDIDRKAEEARLIQAAVEAHRRTFTVDADGEADVMARHREAMGPDGQLARDIADGRLPLRSPGDPA